MNEFEKKRARWCINTIEDCMASIKNEIYNVGKPHKGYLLEKLKPMQNDLNCLISMCEEVNGNEL